MANTKNKDRNKSKVDAVIEAVEQKPEEQAPEATIQPSHEMPEGLKAFKDAQREGKATEEAPEALLAVDTTAQVKNVTVKCNENGSFRVGQQFFALTKGKNAVLPDYVAAEFRKNKLVE